MYIMNNAGNKKNLICGCKVGNLGRLHANPGLAVVATCYSVQVAQQLQIIPAWNRASHQRCLDDYVTYPGPFQSFSPSAQSPPSPF